MTKSAISNNPSAIAKLEEDINIYTKLSKEGKESTTLIQQNYIKTI